MLFRDMSIKKKVSSYGYVLTIIVLQVFKMKMCIFGLYLFVNVTDSENILIQYCKSIFRIHLKRE